MLDGIVRDETQADKKRYGQRKSGKGEPLGAVSVAEDADERRGKGRDHEGDENQASSGGVPEEGFLDKDGQYRVA